MASFHVTTLAGDHETSLLKKPTGVACNADGNIYVVETSENRVSIIKVSDGTLETFAGGTSLEGGIECKLKNPMGICIHDQSGTMYIADCGGDSVAQVKSNKSSRYAGPGDLGKSSTKFARENLYKYLDKPESVSVNPPGTELAVTSTKNCLVFVVNMTNNTFKTVGIQSGGFIWGLTGGSSSVPSMDGDALSASFDHPYWVGFSPLSPFECFVGENCKVRKFDKYGTVATVAGSKSAGFADGPTSQAKFNRVQGGAFHTNGDIYVSDTGNNCIRHISSSNVTTIAGSKKSGSSDGHSLNTAQFKSPMGLCFLPNGDLVVADYGNNKVRRIIGVVDSKASGSISSSSINNSASSNPVQELPPPVASSSNTNEESSEEAPATPIPAALTQGDVETIANYPMPTIPPSNVISEWLAGIGPAYVSYTQNFTQQGFERTADVFASILSVFDLQSRIGINNQLHCGIIHKCLGGVPPASGEQAVL